MWSRRAYSQHCIPRTLWTPGTGSCAVSLTNAAAWKSDPRSLFGTSGVLCRFWRHSQYVAVLTSSIHPRFGKMDRPSFRYFLRRHDGHELRGAAIEWSFCVFASGRALACSCSFVPGRAHANRADILVEQLEGSLTDGHHTSIDDNMLGSHSVSICWSSKCLGLK